VSLESSSWNVIGSIWTLVCFPLKILFVSWVRFQVDSYGTVLLDKNALGAGAKERSPTRLDQQVGEFFFILDRQSSALLLVHSVSFVHPAVGIWHPLYPKHDMDEGMGNDGGVWCLPCRLVLVAFPPLFGPVPECNGTRAMYAWPLSVYDRMHRLGVPPAVVSQDYVAHVTQHCVGFS
jgi:hypothetical protein